MAIAQFRDTNIEMRLCAIDANSYNDATLILVIL